MAIIAVASFADKQRRSGQTPLEGEIAMRSEGTPVLPKSRLGALVRLGGSVYYLLYMDELTPTDGRKDSMRLFLQFFSLSDRYERKARLLPGLLLAAAPALTAGAVLQEFTAWYTAASSAVGVEFLVAIILGHFARARGRRAEDAVWKAWGGAPTIRWLRPWDQTCSDQQKIKWRVAIKRLTGMSLPASVPQGGSQNDVDRQIADATRQLRYVLRGKADAAILATHNEDYGFARNLYGVRWFWVFLCLASAAGCGVAIAFGQRPYLGLAVAVGFTIASILIARELPDYVKRCADRYAESLLASAILVSQAMDEPAKQPKDATAGKCS